MSEGGGGGSALVKVLILGGFLAASCGVFGVAGFLMLAQKPSGAVHPNELPLAVGSTSPTPATASVPPATAGKALDRIRQRGTLLVGMDTGEPPWSGTPPMYFMGKTGDPDGFDVALSHRIAEKIGVRDVKILHAKYSELEDQLLDPAGVDLLVSGYSPDDREGITWSSSYLEYGLCLIVPAKSAVKTTNDLFGKAVGIFDDDAAAAEVKSLVKGYTELVRLEDGYWDQLLSGKFAGFLYDYPYAAAELNAWYKQNPSRAGSLRIAQYNLSDSSYAVGARAGEPELIELVNGVIRDWRASEAYPEAIKEYLSGGVAVDAPVEGKVHVVAAGESLSIIAAKELGSPERWEDLWKANRDRFPNPHLIEVGDKVVIP